MLFHTGFSEKADALDKEWNNVRKLCKDSYIKFYKTEVLTILDDALNNHCGGNITDRFTKSFFSTVKSLCSFFAALYIPFSAGHNNLHFIKPCVLI